MSKRSRNKKKNKQKLQKRIQTAAPSQVDEVVEIEPESQQVETEVEEIESKSIIDSQSRKFIARDVRMIIFTILGLAIILTGVKVMQNRTSYINSFSDWLYNQTGIENS